jgi:glycosyltransferase involved in cell wall biosynthesis
LREADLVVGFDLDGFALREDLPRYVVSLKGIMADEMRFESGWPRLHFRMLSRLEAANARRAHIVTVTSEHSRRIALAAYGLDPSRVRVVPEGIDLTDWSVAERPSEERDAAASLTAQPATGGSVILSVARQYRRKNTIALLRAMTRVRESVPQARLRVVGGGPELNRLRRERRSLGLQGAVELLGEVPGTQNVRAEYRTADVFCLPSLQEGFGIVYLEAMASGLPIVALDAAAVPEIVRRDQAGILVPLDEPEGLGAALVRLLEDSALRRRMGTAGRERARLYDWPEVALRFLDAVAI